MKKKIAIVIVNWNGKDDTIVALDSIDQMDKRGHDVSVIVVDNGSTNDSVAVIKKNHPRVILIETGKNLGFTGGNNIGIQAAIERGADFIWLLNNDIIAHSGALSILNAFNDPQVGAAGSKIYFAPGHEYHKDRYRKSERGKVFYTDSRHPAWTNATYPGKPCPVG